MSEEIQVPRLKTLVERLAKSATSMGVDLHYKRQVFGQGITRAKLLVSIAKPIMIEQADMTAAIVNIEGLSRVEDNLVAITAKRDKLKLVLAEAQQATRQFKILPN